MSAGADVAVLDDAFQHRRVARDLDVVLLAAEEAFPGAVLPRGPYREPASALDRADLIVVTRKRASTEAADAVRSAVRRVGLDRPIVHIHLHPTGLRTLAAWMEGRAEGVHPEGPVRVASGVGDPDSVVAAVKGLGLELSDRFDFPDHHHFTTADLARLRRGSRILIVTEKDAVKLQALAPGGGGHPRARAGGRRRRGGRADRVDALRLAGRRGRPGAESEGGRRVTSQPSPEPTAGTDTLEVEVDVVVVGSGIAGLTFALRVAERCSVLLVTKKKRADSNTNWARGGIAAVMGHTDDPALHVSDTLVAGAGLCHRRVVELVVREGPDRIRDLMAWGAEFDRDPDAKLSLGREGGHSHRRIVHAGDRTGRAIESALLLAAERSERLQNRRGPRGRRPPHRRRGVAPAMYRPGGTRCGRSSGRDRGRRDLPGHWRVRSGVPAYDQPPYRHR